jgi:succinate dehydrogenase flavin-adding protein (antitoxin of CptAB toxin-antitoxin module)
MAFLCVLCFLCVLRVPALIDPRSIERLKWRSRRGLLELDLVFERFWAGPGMEMDESQARALERLLQLPDNDLLDLVMGRAEARDADLVELVGKLRAT